MRGASSPRLHEQQRASVAQEAARLIVEHGVQDFRLAKRKALERLGLMSRAAMPSNHEVELAVAERTRIFTPDLEQSMLPALRRAALEAMILLEPFQPRLTGPVLSGRITTHSKVELHLFADAPENVGVALRNSGIRYRIADRRVRVRRDVVSYYPAYTFEAAGVEIAATIFPERGRGQPPLSAVDGKPIQRAGLNEVAGLLSDQPD